MQKQHISWYESDTESDEEVQWGSKITEQKESNIHKDSTEDEKSSLDENSHSKDESKECEKVTISHFEILKSIGEGGYGKVFLVRKQSNPNKVYAMKILRKSDLWDAKRVQAVRNERNILVTVKHPNVVRLKYALQSSSRFYFIMEYCRGSLLGKNV